MFVLSLTPSCWFNLQRLWHSCDLRVVIGFLFVKCLNSRFIWIKKILSNSSLTFYVSLQLIYGSNRRAKFTLLWLILFYGLALGFDVSFKCDVRTYLVVDSGFNLSDLLLFPFNILFDSFNILVSSIFKSLEVFNSLLENSFHLKGVLVLLLLLNLQILLELIDFLKSSKLILFFLYN